MTQADEAGDARFRRAAVAAAIAHDPRTNPKAFLAELDAGVAQDRALGEANRQLVREFRREALASIPKERRGEFADVPIKVLPDAEFEKFTGSVSGRAVTIIVDGEAQIVVRKSATPESLREEGIHVLQSREPKWRERIGRLDEKTMARWHELDLETQLTLYREKIEIEIDAQQRLRHDLAGEAAATADPARRQQLLARAAAAEHTLKALQSRGQEVDAIGPERRAAIQRGDEARPQYLREPARLFAKGDRAPKVAAPKPDLEVDELHPEQGKTRETPLFHDPEALAKETRRQIDLGKSTWQKDYPKGRLYQVGDPWFEPERYSPRPGVIEQRQRAYRMVEVTMMVDGVETVVDRRREILQLRENARQVRENPRWQQRGSESTERGTLFEEASRQRTLQKTREKIIRQRRLAGREDLGEGFRPNEDELVPIGVLRRAGDEPSAKPLSAQHGGGAGFDDVLFRFRIVNGKVVSAKIVIIEAKGYTRSLTLEDFSAITRNLPKNLNVLREVINTSNLSTDRIKAISNAIDAGQLEFAIHRSPSSGLGERGSASATILDDVVHTHAARRQLEAATKQLKVLEKTGSLTDPERQELTADLARLDKLTERLRKAYAAEPFRSDQVQVVLRAILEGTSKVKSASFIANKYGLRVDEKLPVLGRTAIIDETADDGVYFERARTKIAEAQSDFRRRTRFAQNVAEQARWIDATFVPAKVAPSTPPDVAVVRSTTDRRRAVAVTRPDVTSASKGPTSPASMQLVKLLREGVALAGGRIVPLETVVWDATAAEPKQIGRVLEQVRGALASTTADPSRLRVTIDGAVATDEATLRTLLALPPGVIAKEMIWEPHGQRVWVLQFDASWVASPGTRK
jgi:hypothetical protein